MKYFEQHLSVSDKKKSMGKSWLKFGQIYLIVDLLSEKKVAKKLLKRCLDCESHSKIEIIGSCCLRTDCSIMSSYMRYLANPRLTHEEFDFIFLKMNFLQTLYAFNQSNMNARKSINLRKLYCEFHPKQSINSIFTESQ